MLTPEQNAVYQFLILIFRELRITPALAVPAMRKLADDAERMAARIALEQEALDNVPLTN